MRGVVIEKKKKLKSILRLLNNNFYDIGKRIKWHRYSSNTVYREICLWWTGIEVKIRNISLVVIIENAIQ